MPSTRRNQTSRSSQLDLPILLGSGTALALGAVGAFLGFDLLGDIGPVPTLLVLLVGVFVVGAAVTVRRIFALRTTGGGGRQGRR